MTVQLFHGDCLEVMKDIPAGSVDAIITDLPYGTTQNKWDVVIPFEPMWVAAGRVLKPHGVFVTTASQPFTSALVMSNLKWFKYVWVWEKDRDTGHLNAHRRPMVKHEDIVVFSGGIETYNPQGLKPYGKITKRGSNGNNYGKSGLANLQEFTNYPRSILSFCAHKGKGGHSTQKPVALYEYLTLTYTNLGETVLDIAAGSGTTGVAAVKTGRNFIGIEKELKHFQTMQRRLAELA